MKKGQQVTTRSCAYGMPKEALTRLMPLQTAAINFCSVYLVPTPQPPIYLKPWRISKNRQIQERS